MSGRKNKFSKAMTHLKSSKIDEKIGYLNKEMKKMRVISEQPANSTSDLYSTIEYIPAVPESPAEYTDVPDPNGVRDSEWTQPSNGFDVNDPNTWEDAYNDFSWMYNSDDVAGETDRPVLDHIDVDWTGGVAGSGIMLAHVGWGNSLGYLSNDGVYQPLVTAGSMSSSMIPPIERGTYAGGDHYKGDIPDDKWAAMQSIYAKYEAMIAAGNVATQTIKVWYGWSYFFNGNWDTVGYPKKDTNDGRYILINATLFKKAGDYMSKPHENEIPGYTVVLTQHGLDDPNYYPGNPNGFMDFLRNALDVGREAFDWLMDAAGETADNIMGNQDDDNTASKVDRGLNRLLDTLGAANPLAQALSQVPVFDYSREIAVSMATNEVVRTGNNDVSFEDKQNYINGMDNNVFNSIPVNTSESNYSDGNFYVDDKGNFHSNLGPNGEEGVNVPDNTSTWGGNLLDKISFGTTNRIAVRGKNHTQIVVGADGKPVVVINDYAYINNKSKDKDEIPGFGWLNPKKWMSDPLHKVSDTINGRNEGDENTGELSGIPSSIRGVSHLRVTIPFDQWPADKKKAWNKRKEDHKYLPTNTGDYTFESKILEEGWESPKHTYIDKNQQKRWFKEKDVAPVYPKKAPPKMMNGYHPDLLPKLGTEDTPLPQIKVKKKDLLRGHHLKKDEAQRLIDLVNSLNDYIKRNPEHLAYARERYPKHDPRLATLNYKMDMQLAAADEYVEKHFPENKRLLNKVLKATKQSIKLTDPKTFKSKDGTFTTFNKLERARHFDNEYKPKERKVIKKRRGKSVSRFFYKPKKKTKYDILKDKMTVLDNEMKKMMPDA